MNDFSVIRNVLECQGYKIQEFPNYLKTSALFREGDNSGAITIYPEVVIDHVEGITYSYNQFLGLVLGIKDKLELEKYLSTKNFNLSSQANNISEPLIMDTRPLKPEFLKKLEDDHSYWEGRGIAREVLKELKGGLYKNKYYFPVFNSKGQFIGYSCRILSGGDKRYLIRGPKKDFVYPAFICAKDIFRLKKVYLHEGIPDMASAMTIGIRNNLVQFGTDVSFSVINFLLKIPDIKIILCQNNDDAGRESAIKNRKKLCKYFDWSQVQIKEVTGDFKDLNDILQKDVELLKQWFWGV